MFLPMYDPGIMLIGIVSFVTSLAISGWLRSTYGRWAGVPNAAQLTGADVASAILRANGLADVVVQAVPGQLTDHYNPRNRTVNLSEGIYATPSVSAMAVAAHEVGHAIQHARGYAPLQMRSALAPVAGIGSNLGMILAAMGIAIGAVGMTQIGIMLFAAAVLFSVITLPVEFDASRRALGQLRELNIVTAQDSSGARSVLTAAAMTYVAAAATSIMYLLYFISRSRE